MPTSTSRGGYNWAFPAALRSGKLRPLVDGGEDTVSIGVVIVGTTVRCSKIKIYQRTVYTSSPFAVDCVIGSTELEVGAVDGGGSEFKVGVGGESVFVRVFVGGGSVSVGGGGGPLVGPPTGPAQISPLGQHPMFPLLARTQ
jgi:hypothetical protein